MVTAKSWSRLAALIVGMGSLLGAGSAQRACAAAPIISTGFEAPFVAGTALEGQFGWLRADIGPGTSTAIVQSAIGTAGSQGVLVSRAADSDTRWAMPGTGYPTQRFVVVDFDMNVAPAPVSAGFGPFFGVDTYDADIAPYVLGTLGVDASTGDVLYQVQDTGYLTETGTTVTFNDWFHYRIVLDFQNDTYSGFVNGNLVATTGFVDRGFGLDNFTDADIAAFAAGGDAASIALTSSAVFDNFLVRDGLLGDYDVDGDVDTADYNRWRATFGSAVAMAGTAADGNGNGVVDAADYVVWRNNLGASLFSGTGASAAAGLVSGAVPEPATIAAGLFALPAILSVMFRRQR